MRSFWKKSPIFYFILETSLSKFYAEILLKDKKLVDKTTSSCYNVPVVKTTSATLVDKSTSALRLCEN